MNQFKIIVPVYNAQQYIANCIGSIKSQTYKSWEAIIINDSSTDMTRAVIKENIDDRFTVITNNENLGALTNTIKGIDKICKDANDIIVILDGDDWFRDSRCLEYLDSVYGEDTWMTHGSYKHVSNGIERVNRFELPFDRANRRHSVYHLRTFRNFLYQKINHDDLKEDGAYFKITGDMALLFPMAEMAGEHFKFLDKVLYYYNDMNPINDYKKDLSNQVRVENIIRRRKPYERISDNK